MIFFLTRPIAVYSIYTFPASVMNTKSGLVIFAIHFSIVYTCRCLTFLSAVSSSIVQPPLSQTHDELQSGDRVLIQVVIQ